MDKAYHITLEALPARTVPRPLCGRMNAVTFELNSVQCNRARRTLRPNLLLYLRD